MKARIDIDEWYPVYSVGDDSFGEEAEVPDELVARWKACLKEFNIIQDELARIHDQVRA